MDERQRSLLDLIGDDNSSSPDEAETVPARPLRFDDRLEEFKSECLKCSACGLRSGCRQVVFGEGNPGARLMMVGEGPGADEDRLGRPFVGAAGRLLDRILEAVSLKRDELYIANVVKCRPPANRLPVPAEVEQCLKHLMQQIRLIDPAIIVCLGALATRTLIDSGASITALRGRWYKIDGRSYMPTFHPAALLRDANKKRPVWEDFKQIGDFYHRILDGGSIND